jgi:hypothetical protein
MQNLSDIIKAENRQQLVLGVVLILYILLNVKTPKMLSELIDTIYGNIAVVVIAMVLFSNSNPVVGVLSIVAAYFLIKRSSISTGSFAIEKYLPSEASRSEDFSKLNELPITLEEQMVYKMAPLVKHDAQYPDANYKPVLDSLHEAAPIDYMGVV